MRSKRGVIEARLDIAAVQTFLCIWARTGKAPSTEELQKMADDLESAGNVLQRTINAAIEILESGVES